MRHILYLIISLALLIGLFIPFGTNPRFGNLLLYPMSPLVIGDSDHGVTEMKLPFKGEIWIGNDSLGIPHIKCENEEAAAFAIGFLHAKERLFQMEMIRRQVMGRLTEVAGVKAIDLDRFWRKFRFSEQCRDMFAKEEKADSELFRYYSAYAEGVNTYIGQLDHTRLPIEFRLVDLKPMRFEPWHCLLIYKALAYDLSYEEDDLGYSHIANDIPKELIELYYPWVSPRAFPVYPDLQLSDSQVMDMPAEPLEIYKTSTAFHKARFFKDDRYSMGSNGWVVGQKKSATGNPFLCNDTHLKLRIPSIWFEVVVTTNDGMRRGLTVPTNPLQIIGFNENIAWGETNATWDLVDFYHLDIAADGKTYTLDGKQEALEAYTETFKVRGGDDIAITFYQSYFGPVDTLYGEVLATGWSGEISGNDGMAFYELQRARSVADCARAVQYFTTPAQNFMFIDREGHTGMVTAGVAARHKTLDRGIIHAKRRSDRMEFVSMTGVLREFDPERGWSAAANQEHVAGKAAAWLGYRFLPTARSRRIAELLSDSVEIDRQYLTRMQLDAVDIEWEFMRDKMLANCPDKWRSFLENWDGNCDTSLVAPTLFTAFKRNLCSLFYEEFSPGTALNPQEELVVWLMSTRDTLPLKSGFIETKAFFRKTFDATDEYLSMAYGQDINGWNYGRYHKLWIRHMAMIDQLGPAPMPAMGSNRTINVAGGLPTTTGPSMRILVEMTKDGPKGAFMINGGQSGRFNDPNYLSQIDDFKTGKYHEAPLLKQFDPKQFVSVIHFKSE